MFPKLALIEIRRKRLNLMKTAFPLAFKETRSAPICIGSYPISACAVYTTSAVR